MKRVGAVRQVYVFACCKTIKMKEKKKVFNYYALVRISNILFPIAVLFESISENIRILSPSLGFWLSD